MMDEQLKEKVNQSAAQWEKRPIWRRFVNNFNKNNKF